MNTTKSAASALKTALLLAAAYIALMGIGMAIMYHGFGIAYGSPNFAAGFIGQMIVVAAFTVFALRHTGYRMAPLRSNKSLLWIAPWLLLEAFALIFLLIETVKNPSEIGSILLILLITLLVGFAEESMFRGILLRAALRKFNLAPAMLISAAGFSLLHAVNIFGGIEPVAVPGQLVMTFLFGLVTAPLALLMRSLWPLILMHAMWDFILLSVSRLPGIEGLVPIMSLTHLVLIVVIGIPAWVVVLKRGKQAL